MWFLFLSKIILQDDYGNFESNRYPYKDKLNGDNQMDIECSKKK
jgi:hypothetical protein